VPPSVTEVGQFGPGEQVVPFAWKAHEVPLPPEVVQVATTPQLGTVASPHSQVIPFCDAEQALLAAGAVWGHGEEEPASA
jgi:hypothetical protein